MKLGHDTERATRVDESALLVSVARGDVDALRLLYRAFERPLYSLGRRWLGNAELAEELVQEVTLRIWRRAGSFDPQRGAAASWVFGVARHVAADLARSNRRLPVPVADPIADRTTAPWDDEAAWRGWQVARVVAALPRDQGRVVELAYVHQLTQAEIARALGIPLGTVKTRLYAGLSKARTELVAAGVMEDVG
jgi:RNA polymerase sigma-70 factor, ECF subfamily